MCVLYIVCACEEGPEPGLGWSWGEEGASEGGGRSDLLIRSSAVHSVCQCVSVSVRERAAEDWLGKGKGKECDPPTASLRPPSRPLHSPFLCVCLCIYSGAQAIKVPNPLQAY